MIRKYVVWYMVFAMLVIGIAPRVEAGFAPSETFQLAASVRASDMETIRAALENKIVSQRLHDLGFTGDEITSRLSDLSDAQLHSMAKKIDDLKVGKDGGAAVLLLLLIVLVIVVVYFAASGRRIVVTK